MPGNGILTERGLAELADRVVRLARPEAVEAIVSGGDGGGTRFSDNEISQNVAEKNVQVTIRLIDGNRTARATTNQTDEKSLLAAIRSARAILRARRATGRLLPLPGPQRYRQGGGWTAATARLDPRGRAEAVAQACRPLRRQRLDGAGMYETVDRAVSVFNSRGLLAYCRQTFASLAVTARTPDGGAGWAEAVGHDASRIAPEELAAVAADKALRSRKPRPLPPGAYDVILEPAAVAELLAFLGYLGFAALPYLEKRGPLSGKIGRKVFSDSLTIDDDAYHPIAQGIPFDFEGVPRQAVRLVDAGKLVGLVHDRVTARRMGVSSTGHALPQPSSDGPMPLSLVVHGGSATVDDLIASTRRGILVTQFHYTNVLDPGRLVVTGMTRNGTFLVERGRVTAPVKNLRFTEGLLQALSRIDGIGREQVAASAFLGGATVTPALKIRGFRFTSATEF